MAKRTREELQVSLRQKISVCALDEPAGLDEEELLELQRQTLELANRWLSDLTKKRNGKGTGAALAIVQQMGARIDTTEDRKRVGEENKQRMGLAEITITYQEPDPAIVAKVKGADNDGASSD